MFIQIIQGKCTRQDDLRTTLDRWLSDRGSQIDGWLGGTYGFTDDDDFIAVMRFESRELAMANSDSQEQSEWWAKTEKLFDGPVEFHDCDKVLVMMDGGSDSAGFVQVIRGKIEDLARFEADLDEMTSMLHEARPEIIGATFAVEADGTFTETVSFTDEAAAREGESKAMPLSEEVRHSMKEWDALAHDLSYLDLHKPFFASHR